MKVIRWFLSHIILILLVVAVIYGYMFWGNLIGEKTPAGKAIAYLSSEFVVVEEFVEAVKEKQAQLASEDQSSESQSSSRPSEDVAPAPADETLASASQINAAQVNDRPAPPAVPVASTSSPSANVSPTRVPPARMPPANTQAEFTQARQAPQAMPGRQGNDTTSDLQSAGNASRTNISDGVAGALVPSAPKRSDVFISEKVEKQLDNVDGSGKVIDPAQQASDARNSWITARKAYYQRQYDVSEKNYQDVIDNTPDNFDAYGELGNVYFNQGKNEQAAAAYLSAASILIRKGQVNRARGLLGLLRHLDKDKAEELQKLITSASSSPS